MYERAFEAFILDAAKTDVVDPTIRARLAKLTAPTDLHGERIAAEIARLEARLDAVDPALVERAALQDVLEVERAARAFYLRFVEEARDARVAELFRALAREEGARIRIAEEALTANERKLDRPRVGKATEDILRRR